MWITRWRVSIVRARKPADDRVCIARVQGVTHRRLERFVMRWHRPVLQSSRDVYPREPIFVQDEGAIAWNGIESRFISGGSKLGRFTDGKIWLTESCPLALCLVPPNQLLVLAPRFTSWCRARPVVDDAPIPRPGEAPAMTKIIFRVA